MACFCALRRCKLVRKASPWRDFRAASNASAFFLRLLVSSSFSSSLMKRRIRRARRTGNRKGAIFYPNPCHFEKPRTRSALRHKLRHIHDLFTQIFYTLTVLRRHDPYGMLRNFSGRSSSGAEHSLGKGEAGGSIPPCGTILFLQIQRHSGALAKVGEDVCAVLVQSQRVGFGDGGNGETAIDMGE